MTEYVRILVLCSGQLGNISAHVMRIQQTTAKRSKREPRLPYLLAALILFALLLASLAVFRDKSSNPIANQLHGTWKVQSGSLVTIHADGTAIEGQPGDASARRYTWSLDDELILFERVQKGKNLLHSAEEFIERLVGDSNGDAYRIVELSKESLTLTVEENNARFTWTRDNEENEIVRDQAQN